MILLSADEKAKNKESSHSALCFVFQNAMHVGLMNSAIFMKIACKFNVLAVSFDFLDFAKLKVEYAQRTWWELTIGRTAKELIYVFKKTVLVPE